MIEVHLLGTAGYHPSPARHTACFMLPADGIVLDAGTAFFRVRERICTPRLDIFLSHAHLDHCCGLTFLLDVLYGQSVNEVTVHGRPSDLEAIRTTLFGSPLFPLAFEHTLQPIETTTHVADWTVTTRAQVHPGGSLGYRFQQPGAAFAYITDTTADPEDRAALEFIRGVDLLIHECNFPDEYADLAGRSGHSTVTAVAQVAKQANVGQLVLTHVSPLARPSELEALLRTAQAIFPRATLGADEMVVRV